MTTDLLIRRQADFSPCEKYRYYLEVIWDYTKPNLVMILLNPSVADQFKNDPTVERCQRRARLLGYGGLIVLNVFAWRSTDPAGLYTCEDPIGEDNDKWIRNVLYSPNPTIVCGWGKHAEMVQPGRSGTILAMIAEAGLKPHALGVNKDGSCAHPLYIGYDVRPFVYDHD